ncbi:MAG TPA: sulfotransferase family protein [Planctomycetaceae bacterium]|nr:sulfotransferase family protein [Planctomycetaceae bacterium]
MITVVSGLPRSGTSLVMQMLAAGGFPILSDELRPADEDNPRGYLEFAKVKSLERDSTWLSQAEGKAVKIISFLLPKLPSNFEYRVIFLRRDLNEVLQSQEKMLSRRSQPPGPPSDVMATHFQNHLKSVDTWLSGQSNLQLLNVDHAQLIQTPARIATAIRDLLKFELDGDKMVSCVDPDLHRQKAT